MWIKKKDWENLQKKVEKLEKDATDMDKFLFDWLSTQKEYPIAISIGCTLMGSVYTEIQYLSDYKIKTIMIWQIIHEPEFIHNSATHLVLKDKFNTYYVIDKKQGVYSELPEFEVKLVTKGKAKFCIQGEEIRWVKVEENKE